MQHGWDGKCSSLLGNNMEIAIKIYTLLRPKTSPIEIKLLEHKDLYKGVLFCFLREGVVLIFLANCKAVMCFQQQGNGLLSYCISLRWMQPS